MAKEFKLTKESLDKLKEELDYLKTVREREVAEQIKEARSFGDLSENAEYDEAKNEQGKVFSRMVELENIISHTVIIDEKDISVDKISTGAKVRVLSLEDNEEQIFHIAGSQEANPSVGKISDDSPFGKALLGLKKGDTAIVMAPAGNFEYKILEIMV